MKLYLAGPMRGLTLFGFPAFFQASLVLRALGHEVANPAERDMAAGLDPSEENTSPEFALADAFSWDFSEIIAAQGVALLPGWQDSEGCRAELLVAHYTGTPAYEYAPDAPNCLRALEWDSPPEVWLPDLDDA